MEAAQGQQLEGVADRAAGQVVGLPQGLPVAGNKRVGLVKAQELVQPAGGSRAEVRPGGRKRESHDRNTAVNMRVHENGGVPWEHTSWLFQTGR